ncbi:MAG: hybrid sensor histidine kinase/response regulator [Desulfobacterales bacterium]|nr:hybrid sensor histidine kinase/response regulator [Desulfobacterales bacterium]
MINQEELLRNFVEESQQHLQAIEPYLLELESNLSDVDSEVINRIFRAIHSIKGASGFFGLNNISEISHVMENLLSMIRDGKMKPNSEMVDALLNGIDSVRAMLSDISSSDRFDISKDLSLLQSFLEHNDKKQAENIKNITVYEMLNPNKKEPPRKFEISEDKLLSFIKKGFYLYSVDISINENLTLQGKTPYDLINSMAAMGQVIDSKLGTSNISGLEDCLTNDLSFVMLYATIMEPSLLPIGLEIEEDKYAVIDLEAFKDKQKQKISSELKAFTPQDAKLAQNIAFTEPSPPEKTPVKEQEVKIADDKPQIKEIKQIQDKPIDKTVRTITTEEKIRVGVNLLNDLVNLAGELVLARNQLMRVALSRVKDTPGLNPVLQHLSRITTDVQSKIMQMRMQPVALLFGKFPRIVRDLAKSLNKEIKLITYGEDVELDKTIIEALSDPLTHLIRNSIDHGIESPEEREKKGKTKAGTLELRAYHQAGQVYIEVNDDGKGIDGNIVAEKAVEKGIITKDQLNSMNEKERIRLIFKPGFSTAKEVTSVSGRGVGMDVVITNIKKLGGIVDIETVPNKGTKMRLALPLTLAIVSGLVVKIGEQYFIIPEANIEELVRITPEEFEERINVVQDALVLRLREMLLPLINLKKLLKISDETDESLKSKTLRILVTRHGSFRQGIIVDSLENIEEIVVKALPRYLKRMKSFSGASIMGNGSIALILDVAGLVEKAKLRHLESTIEETKFKEEKIATRGETQTLLLFDNATDERFALPLELITRIERVPSSSIEKVRDDNYLQYQGKKLKLIYLENYLPINRPKREGLEFVGVIIPKFMKYPIGIIINKVIGTVNTEVELDTETIMAPGLFGSAVIDDKIALLPDMYKLFELAIPELYQNQQADKRKGKKGKYRILLVDDTAFFRMVESEYLLSAGYDVIQAEGGRKALSILEEKQIDAVVLDIIMPDLDGWEVVKIIRENPKWKNLPVMAVTSLGEEELVERGKTAGFSDWEVKLNKTRLLEKLKSLLKQ